MADKKRTAHTHLRWFLFLAVFSIVVCSCAESKNDSEQTRETEALPAFDATPSASDGYTPVVSSYKRRELVINPDNLSTEDHIDLYHTNGPLQELLLDEEQLAEYLIFRNTGERQPCGRWSFAYHANDNLYAWVHHFGLQKEVVKDKLYSCRWYYSDFDLDVIFDHDALYVDQFYREDRFYQHHEVHKSKMRDMKRTLINRFKDENPDGYAAFVEKYITDRAFALQNTDYTLADLLHAMQLPREEAKAVADDEIGSARIDVDMLYDRYDDLLAMQEAENLYPVEIDMLCWGEVVEDPYAASPPFIGYENLAPGEDPPPWPYKRH